MLKYKSIGLLFTLVSCSTFAQDTTGTNNDQIFHLAKRIANSDKLTDIDGNEYDTIKIGPQWWMKENLKTSRYCDGAPIAETEDSSAWADASRSKTGAWCYYEGKSINNPTFGKLYNWYAVNSAHRLCPAGWHVPSDSDWVLLMDFLDGKIIQKDYIPGLQEMRTRAGWLEAKTMWANPNIYANNLTRFTALPAGGRMDGSAFVRLHPSEQKIPKSFGKRTDFSGQGFNCSFWTSTLFNDHVAWYRTLFGEKIYRQHNYMGTGNSVRCTRD